MVPVLPSFRHQINQVFFQLTFTPTENLLKSFYVKDPGSSRPPKERQADQILDTSGYKVYMNGSMVFKHAVVRFMEVINEALTANNLKKRTLIC